MFAFWRGRFWQDKFPFCNAIHICALISYAFSYMLVTVSFSTECPMSKIDIYTKPYCPYCERAKALLEQKGAEYNEIVASHDPALRAEMNERSGRYTYPQIFIDDKHV